MKLFIDGAKIDLKTICAGMEFRDFEELTAWLCYLWDFAKHSALVPEFALYIQLKEEVPPYEGPKRPLDSLGNRPDRNVGSSPVPPEGGEADR